MATVKQRKALDKTLEYRGNVTKAMREVGYSEATIHNPKDLTESKGWKQLCEERGLTDDFLVQALVEDIKNKPGNRRAELDLGFKVTGKLSDKPEGNKTLIVNITPESATRYGVTPNTKTSSS